MKTEKEIKIECKIRHYETLTIDQLQAASEQAYKYVRFWAYIIRTATRAEVRHYCMKRYERALTLSAECNRLISEYLGHYM